MRPKGGSRKGFDLQLIFGSASPPIVVSDSSRLIEFAVSCGFSAISIDQVLAHPPPAVLFVPINWQQLRPYLKALSAAFSVSRVLSVPVAAFDTSSDAATYTLLRLLESDIHSAIEAGIMWESRLQGNECFLRFRGIESHLEFQMASSSQLSFRRQPEIAIGQQVPIGHYLEAEIEEPFSTVPPFHVSGTICTKAILAARAVLLPQECYAKYDQAQQLVKEINSSGEHILIEVSDSVVTKCTVGSVDYLSTLNYLTNQAHDLTLTEFAIGLNRSIHDTVDWSVNSVLNEGAGQLHLGLGDGCTGVHMDFICDDLVEWSGGEEPYWQAC